MQQLTIENRLDNLSQTLTEQALLHKEILNLAEAARYLCLSKSYLYILTGRHAIPFYRPGGKRIFFRKTDLDSWLLQNRHASSQEIERSTANYLITNRK